MNDLHVRIEDAIHALESIAQQIKKGNLVYSPTHDEKIVCEVLKSLEHGHDGVEYSNDVVYVDVQINLKLHRTEK